MIQTFIHEINKQIASTKELYEITKFDIFKKRIENLEAQKSEILITLRGLDYISH